MTRERRALKYAIHVLSQKYAMLADLGPATDVPEEAASHLEDLAFAAVLLERPYLPVSPFL